MCKARRRSGLGWRLVRTWLFAALAIDVGLVSVSDQPVRWQRVEPM